MDGGNHSQFGSYGFQKGDVPADISADERLRMTIDAIEDWILSVSLS
ncbi:alpha/beta hydrolase [Paenibacillus cellulosilyticus]|nr:alpha/beta hydrolase [Paenibacillus cellulosilyticus]